MSRALLMTSVIFVAAAVARAEDAATQPAIERAAIVAKLDAANARIAELEAQVATLQAKLDGASAQAKQSVAVAAAAEARAATAEQRVVTAEAQVATVHDDGTARSLKRIVKDQVKVGMPIANVTALLGEPKDKRRDGNADVYVYQRADVGHQGHGAFTPGPKVTLMLTFDEAGVLRSIDSQDR